MAEHPPATVDRPLVVYDGRCSFCRRWVARAQSITGNLIVYEPYQSAALRFPQVDPTAFGKAVHLIEPDGAISRGAQAVFRALYLGRRYPWLLRLYEYVPGFARLTESAYHVVATHRDAADWIDLRLIGPAERQPSYIFTRQLFLRLLGAIYLMAFLSLWMQIDGLIGSKGILPVDWFLRAVRASIGPERYWLFPTLCWTNSSDVFLHLLCVGGCVVSILVIAGIAQLPALILSFAFYLSLTTAGQVFLEFQWDSLLLEAGFLAIFFSPAGVWANRLSTQAEPSRFILWMFRWLLFRLTFMSGVVKLTSGDVSWHAWRALRYHYMTQPLPPWTAWYFHQLPAWFQTLSCGVVFLEELVIPFLMLGPRRIRLIAFWAMLLFQLLIAITGNYGFFNLLTMVLCIILADDLFWRRILWLRPANEPIAPPPSRRGWMTLPVSIALLVITLPICIAAFNIGLTLPPPLSSAANFADSFRIANGYGLFAVMSTDRPEIIIEGSDDQISWKPYEFKWKPGDVHHRPGFTTPFMPRLDWQMWFPFLGSEPQENTWFVMLLQRLHEGSKPVLDLLATNPFPDHPPKYVRATLYEYQMTNPIEKKSTGDWWKRKEIGTYFGLPAE